MKRLSFLLAASAVLVLLSSFTPTAPDILGTWKADQLENSTIEVYQADDGYIYGKIIDSDQKSWIGEVILKKVKYDPKKKEWVGKVYSLRMYFSVDATLTLEGSEKLKLVGRRFYMSKTFYWERVDRK